MSYAEHLLTTNPITSPGAAPQVSLLRACSPEAAQIHLQHWGNEPFSYDRVALHEATLIQRRTISALGRVSNGHASPTEAAYYMSECLDEAGIKHAVGFANNRAFAALEMGTVDMPSLYMLDPLEPDANANLAPMLYRGTAQTVRFDIAQTPHHRAVAMIDTSQLETQYPGHPLTPDAAQFEKGIFERGSREQNLAYGVPASFFSSAVGRSVLDNFSAFRISVQQGDLSGACYFLSAISGQFPDIDARSPHKDIQVLMRGLVKAGNREAAARAHHDYWSSFYMTNHPRLQALQTRLESLHQDA